MLHFIDYIYFFYGLAFFLFGFSILHYPIENSIFKFTRELKYLGTFVILHGISEWLVMFQLHETGETKELLHLACFIAMTLSYGVLLYFALRVIWNRSFATKLLILLLLGSFILMTWFDLLSLDNANILARYILGTPAIFLTAYVFAHPSYLVQGSAYTDRKSVV